MTTLQTMRIPRGLWADLEETVIQQDRQFLTEVARNLGLPIQEVLRKCLGSGAPQQVQVIVGEELSDLCPWWLRSEGGCWRACGRLRASPSAPCSHHTHAQTGPALCLSSDSRLASLPTLTPVSYEGEIYWIGDGTHTYREDGSIEPTLEFKFIDHRDQRICIVVHQA